MDEIQSSGERLGVSGFRQQRMGIGRRLIGWIAAYAFVLHAVLAGAVATQLAATSPAAAGFEICLTGADGTPLPGHTQSQHENCAIHCATVGGALPLLALALLALVFFPRTRLRPVRFFFPRPFEYLCRAGLSRAPPLPA
jgi:hypothetical protein